MSPQIVVEDPHVPLARCAGWGFLGGGLLLGADGYMDGIPASGTAGILAARLVLLVLSVVTAGVGVLLVSWRHVLELDGHADAVERWSTLISRRVVTHGRVSACEVAPLRHGGYALDFAAKRQVQIGPYATFVAAQREHERIARHLQDCAADRDLEMLPRGVP